MLEMEYRTNFQLEHDHSLPFGVFKHKIANFLWSLPEPAAHSAAFQLVRMDRGNRGIRGLDRSLAACICLIGLAVLEELI